MSFPFKLGVTASSPYYRIFDEFNKIEKRYYAIRVCHREKRKQGSDLVIMIFPLAFPDA